MTKKRLSCWWGSHHVADIEERTRWDLRLRYTEEARERWPNNLPALSCSLPVSDRWQKASNFLRGMLAEGQHLQALAALINVVPADTFGLLKHYGRDIAGALEFVPFAKVPDRLSWSTEEYTDAGLVEELVGLPTRALGIYPDSELSIAGLQNKLLLVKLGPNKWARPINGQPSTHILKLEDNRYPGMAMAELDCLRLAENVGLSNLEPETLETHDLKCLIVKRFDRFDSEGQLERRHQEDACQALGIDHEAHRGRGKYETNGGPTFQQVAQLLRSYSSNPQADVAALLHQMVFTTLIGNSDGHGKNLSLIHSTAGYVSLAPMYDVVPTMLWPKLRTSAAMSINGKTSWHEIDLEAVVNESQSWALPATEAERLTKDIVSKVAASLAAVKNQELADRIGKRCDRVLAGKPVEQRD